MHAALTEGGAEAALAASIFHFGELTIENVKKHLASRGLSGMHRARVLAAIRAYCTFLFTAELNGAAFG